MIINLLNKMLNILMVLLSMEMDHLLLDKMDDIVLLFHLLYQIYILYGSKNMIYYFISIIRVEVGFIIFFYYFY